MEAMPKAAPRHTPGKVPDSLIYETMDEKPVYRKGYRLVLNGVKKLEDIVGSSTLQSEIISYLIRRLMLFYDEQVYAIHTNEAGLHISKGNNLAGDIFVYERSVMTAENINKNYSSVPPLLAFEVDTETAVEVASQMAYISGKIEKLIQFGVQKVFWISTEAKRIIVAEPDKDWRTISWKNDVEITPGLLVNIAGHLEQQGIK